MNNIEHSFNNREITIPRDITLEELALLDLVKQKMLQKLNDRRKFIFLYVFELGKSQKEVSEVLGVHETSVSRHMRKIREILTPFK